MSCAAMKNVPLLEPVLRVNSFDRIMDQRDIDTLLPVSTRATLVKQWLHVQFIACNKLHM